MNNIRNDFVTSKKEQTDAIAKLNKIENEQEALKIQLETKGNSLNICQNDKRNLRQQIKIMKEEKSNISEACKKEQIEINSKLIYCKGEQERLLKAETTDNKGLFFRNMKHDLIIYL